MRCSRCGNENPGTNRFCGMCGATLLQTPADAPNVAPAAPSGPVVPAPVAPPARAATQAPAAARPAVNTSGESAGISGPSFLGLNEPRPSAQPRRHGSLSIDPNSAPSPRSLDYLLEDDHEHRSGGALKFILILLALALAVGFGYLRFKDQGLAWLKGSASKPPATQSSDGSDAGSTAPVAGTDNSAAATSTPDHSAPATAAAQLPAGAAPASGVDSSAGTPSSTTPSSSAPASSTPSSTTPTGTAPANPAAGATNTPPPAASGDAGRPPKAAAKSATPPAAAKKTNADASDESEADTDSDSAPAATESPKPPAKAPKPSASVPARSDTAVIEARNYIYGRGVRQDCERGMRLLKPAADQGNPKAMIEMGALYSAGLCTPRDLPTAYRWFALALRKDPENQSVQTDLQKLWGEMTQPERQLAIKLSQ